MAQFLDPDGVVVPGSIGSAGASMFSAIPGAAWMDAGAKVLSSVLSTPPAGPSNVAARLDQTFSSPFDGSGWNVNFGSGAINSNRTQEEATPASAITKSVMDWVPMVALGIGAVILWKTFIKSK